MIFPAVPLEVVGMAGRPANKRRYLQYSKNILIRGLVTLFLSFMVYRETGIWTALVVLFIAIDSEMTNHLFRLTMRVLRQKQEDKT